jgi:2-phosphoxylose phosphatase
MRATAACVLLVSLGSAVNATVVHYPPKATSINNFTFIMQGAGAPGIFNSSFTPAKQYGEYNWCSMPHVRSTEYK